jgi:hypothetical protein
MRLLRFAYSFIGFPVLLLFTACMEGDTDKDKPLNLIPEEELVGLLIDLSISESAANANIKQAPNQKLDSVYAFNPLKERNIRKGQYDSTLAYYSEHIAEYKAIYELVLARIGAMQAQSAGAKAVKTPE